MVILIAGKMGAGKDTFKQILKEEFEKLDVKKWDYYKFAGILKKFTVDVFSTDLYRLEEDREFKENKDPIVGISPREFMQFVGTELGRKIKPTLWSDIFFNTMSSDRNYIISDHRYIDDYENLKNKGCNVISILIKRDTEYTSNHSSEQTELLYTDYVIDNNGSMEDLREKGKKLAKIILEKYE